MLHTPQLKPLQLASQFRISCWISDAERVPYSVLCKLNRFGCLSISTLAVILIEISTFPLQDGTVLQYRSTCNLINKICASVKSYLLKTHVPCPTKIVSTDSLRIWLWHFWFHKSSFIIQQFQLSQDQVQCNDANACKPRRQLNNKTGWTGDPN
jgi:hypothetical protein